MIFSLFKNTNGRSPPKHCRKICLGSTTVCREDLGGLASEMILLGNSVRRGAAIFLFCDTSTTDCNSGVFSQSKQQVAVRVGAGSTIVMKAINTNEQKAHSSCPVQGFWNWAFRQNRSIHHPKFCVLILQSEDRKSEKSEKKICGLFAQLLHLDVSKNRGVYPQNGWWK